MKKKTSVTMDFASMLDMAKGFLSGSSDQTLLYAAASQSVTNRGWFGLQSSRSAERLVIAHLRDFQIPLTRRVGRWVCPVSARKRSTPAGTAHGEILHVIKHTIIRAVIDP